MAETLNKKSIAELVAEKHKADAFALENAEDITGVNDQQQLAEAAEIIDLVFDTVSGTLKDGGRVDISGFGKFEVKTRAARTGINPQTKETITIPESKVPGFKAAKNLKELVK